MTLTKGEKIGRLEEKIKFLKEKKDSELINIKSSHLAKLDRLIEKMESQKQDKLVNKTREYDYYIEKYTIELTKLKE
jgi:hypothetical protein